MAEVDLCIPSDKPRYCLSCCRSDQNRFELVPGILQCECGQLLGDKMLYNRIQELQASMTKQTGHAQHAADYWDATRKRFGFVR